LNTYVKTKKKIDSNEEVEEGEDVSNKNKSKRGSNEKETDVYNKFEGSDKSTILKEESNRNIRK